MWHTWLFSSWKWANWGSVQPSALGKENSHFSFPGMPFAPQTGHWMESLKLFGRAEGVWRVAPHLSGGPGQCGGLRGRWPPGSERPGDHLRQERLRQARCVSSEARCGREPPSSNRSCSVRSCPPPSFLEQTRQAV